MAENRASPLPLIRASSRAKAEVNSAFSVSLFSWQKAVTSSAVMPKACSAADAFPVPSFGAAFSGAGREETLTPLKTPSYTALAFARASVARRSFSSRAKCREV